MADDIYIEHEDGTVWKVPLKTIAFKRAEHYADSDTRSTGGEQYETTFEEEIEKAMDSPHLATGYVRSSMSWRTVKEFADKVGETTRPPRRLPTADMWAE